MCACLVRPCSVYLRSILSPLEVYTLYFNPYISRYHHSFAARSQVLKTLTRSYSSDTIWSSRIVPARVGSPACEVCLRRHTEGAACRLLTFVLCVTYLLFHDYSAQVPTCFLCCFLSSFSFSSAARCHIHEEKQRNTITRVS